LLIEDNSEAEFKLYKLLSQAKEISFKSVWVQEIQANKNNFNIIIDEGSRFYLNYMYLKYSDI